ncbi:hypothetical protein C7451_107254 [Blastomonas natatoria]|uniref:DUF4175 domain-containing protein n=1 Tax=Blastomonas natatoria TaxID=34015 RepID=A0A2V3V0L5_9SPHN|nr:hypothetical protein [Blastomonas natatoria]PXW75282.1 hypothetical protein C7451_107254 [Blastomonas natatoria]
MSNTRSLRTIFALPFAIFVIGLAGLIIALTGDGWRDVAAWMALSAPVAAAAWAMRARRT